MSDGPKDCEGNLITPGALLRVAKAFGARIVLERRYVQEVSWIEKSFQWEVRVTATPNMPKDKREVGRMFTGAGCRLPNAMRVFFMEK